MVIGAGGRVRLEWSVPHEHKMRRLTNAPSSGTRLSLSLMKKRVLMYLVHSMGNTPGFPPVLPNAQLTDGGPPLAPKLPGRISGPPFGAAPGSDFLIIRSIDESSISRKP